MTNETPTMSTLDDTLGDYFDVMFEIYRLEEGKASVKHFIEELRKTGLRISDPRLANMVKLLNTLKPLKIPSIESLKLEEAIFKSVVGENIVLITKALRNHMVIPAFEAFTENIRKIYTDCLMNRDGKVSEGNSKNEEKWGVSICTIDGQRFSIGDVLDPFCIQSISKPIMYGICLNQLKEKTVHKYQGRESSGTFSNEIALDYNNKPHNPLVESGGLLSASLILQLVKPELNNLAQKYEYVHQIFEKMAGGEYVGFNNSEFLAQRLSMDRHRALAYFLRENHCFPECVDLQKTLDFYLQISALEVTCESCSVISATLANGGVCPITMEKLLDQEDINNMTALMHSCGMYMYSGQFAFDIGLPAMSSGGGALMVVIPNVMGITLWSPKLDCLHNSFRGVEFCKKLLKIYNFHRFDGVGLSTSAGKMNPTLQKRYQLNSVSHQGVQLLYACGYGDLPYLKRAFIQNCDMNMFDSDNRTALHLASAEGHLECVQFLIQICKVDPDIKDRWGNTALLEAKKFCHKDVVDVLEKYVKDRSSTQLNHDEDDDENGHLVNASVSDTEINDKYIKAKFFKDWGKNQLPRVRSASLSQYFKVVKD